MPFSYNLRPLFITYQSTNCKDDPNNVVSKAGSQMPTCQLFAWCHYEIQLKQYPSPLIDVPRSDNGMAFASMHLRYLPSPSRLRTIATSHLDFVLTLLLPSSYLSVTSLSPHFFPNFFCNSFCRFACPCFLLACSCSRVGFGPFDHFFFLKLGLF